MQFCSINLLLDGEMPTKSMEDFNPQLNRQSEAR